MVVLRWSSVAIVGWLSAEEPGKTVGESRDENSRESEEHSDAESKGKGETHGDSRCRWSEATALDGADLLAAAVGLVRCSGSELEPLRPDVRASRARWRSVGGRMLFTTGISRPARAVRQARRPRPHTSARSQTVAHAVTHSRPPPHNMRKECLDTRMHPRACVVLCACVCVCMGGGGGGGVGVGGWWWVGREGG